MSIPDFQSLMLPLLEVIGDGTEHSNCEVAAIIAKKYALTEDDLQQTLASGQKVFTNRLAWAKAHMKKAQLLESVSKRSLRITSRGKEVLAQPRSSSTYHISSGSRSTIGTSQRGLAMRLSKQTPLRAARRKS